MWTNNQIIGSLVDVHRSIVLYVDISLCIYLQNTKLLYCCFNIFNHLRVYGPFAEFPLFGIAPVVVISEGLSHLSLIILKINEPSFSRSLEMQHLNMLIFGTRQILRIETIHWRGLLGDIWNWVYFWNWLQKWLSVSATLSGKPLRLRNAAISTLRFGAFRSLFRC